MKGEGNQQDYGFRIYDPRLGKFLSVDPLTKIYPELTPYQFASNRPVDGVDLDGLEFMKYNNSYISLYIKYDPVQKRITSMETSFRVDEFKRGSNEWMILPGALNGKIKSKWCNCVPNYDSRVASVTWSHQKPDEPQMTDAESETVAPQEFRTLRVARTKDEARQIEKSGEFWTPGISGRIGWVNRGVAAIELLGKGLEQLGNNNIKRIVSDAQGYQTFNAITASNLVQSSIFNHLIPSEYLNNSSLTAIGNYLLYGKVIEDKKLEGLARQIWIEYDNQQKAQSFQKRIKSSQKESVDNTGRNNGAGF